jgi:hypothetical protein
MFIAKDPVAGAVTLMDPANVAKLTGAKVTECGFVPFTERRRV